MVMNIFKASPLVGLCCVTFAIVAASSIDGVAADQNITTSRDQYIYWTYQSSCESGGIAGIQGFVALEEFEVVGAVADPASCSREIACFFGPESDACKSLTPNGVASTFDAVLTDGSVYECDTSNPLTGEDVCAVYEGDACFQSSIYPSCQGAGYVFQDQLSDSNLFANPSESEQSDLSQYYYIIFYDNEGCNDPVGIRGFVSDEQYQLTLLPETVTCEDAMACLYNLDGNSCMERGGEARVNFTYTFDPETDDSVSCAGTLADSGAVDCLDIPPDRCIQSGAFAASPCMFRVVSASYLARNPGALVGDFGGIGNVGSGMDETDDEEEGGGDVTSEDSDTSSSDAITISIAQYILAAVVSVTAIL